MALSKPVSSPRSDPVATPCRSVRSAAAPLTARKVVKIELDDKVKVEQSGAARSRSPVCKGKTRPMEDNYWWRIRNTHLHDVRLLLREATENSFFKRGEAAVSLASWDHYFPDTTVGALWERVEKVLLDLQGRTGSKRRLLVTDDPHCMDYEDRYFASPERFILAVGDEHAMQFSARIIAQRAREDLGLRLVFEEEVEVKDDNRMLPNFLVYVRERDLAPFDFDPTDFTSDPQSRW